MQTIIDAKAESKSYKKYYLIAVAVVFPVIVAWLAMASSNTETAVELSQLQTATVSKGLFVKDIRAPGNLVAKNRQWLSAQVSAKVSKRLLEPGAIVTPDSIIVQLSSPDLIQEYKREKIQLDVVLAQLEALRETQTTEKHRLEADVRLLTVEKEQAIEDAIAKKQLRITKIIPEYQYKEAVLREQQLTLELEIAKFELQQLPRLQASLLKVEQARVEQQKLQVSLLQEQVDQLNVRAGMTGILQSIAVEEGQEVNKGTELARVADQTSLKAELRVQESQAKDIGLGQNVIIDTRRSQISGTVSRIDPAVLNGTVTIDIDFTQALPEEARPDLRVNGTIEIERIENALLLNKPSNWQANNNYLFKLDNNQAVKTQIQVGSVSTNKLQILSGLNTGDTVILSDLSQFNHLAEIAVH